MRKPKLGRPKKSVRSRKLVKHAAPKAAKPANTKRSRAKPSKEAVVELDASPTLPSTPTLGAFLTQFGLLEADLGAVGLDWKTLSAISDQHVRDYAELVSTADYIANRLRRHPDVHSVKARVKEPAHLLEKVYRKKKESSKRAITSENYRSEITDLIGIRVLHLFKGEWRSIDRSIQQSWDLAEKPIAYVRRGDPDTLIESFKDCGCNVREHEMGYRSVHYLIKSHPARQERVAEIQVRTIFEEGWSEIDHRIRYPYRSEDAMLSQFLSVFNGLAGSADEMGTFIQVLRDALDQGEASRHADRAEHTRKVAQLQEQIAELKIDSKQKQALEKRVKELESRSAAAHYGSVVPMTAGNVYSTGSLAAKFIEGMVGGIVPGGMSSSLKSILGPNAASLVVQQSPDVVVIGRRCTSCFKTLDSSVPIADSLCANCRAMQR